MLGDASAIRHLRIIWRRERDSNPRRAFDPYTLSRGAPSTTRPSLRGRELPTELRSYVLASPPVGDWGVMILARGTQVKEPAHPGSDQREGWVRSAVTFGSVVDGSSSCSSRLMRSKISSRW